MNDKKLVSMPPYDLKRILRKIRMVIGEMLLIPQICEQNVIKWGWVKLKGRFFIGSNVQFDGIYPNLIEIDEGCIITSGVHILTDFFNTKDRRFYAGKVRIGKKGIYWAEFAYRKCC